MIEALADREGPEMTVLRGFYVFAYALDLVLQGPHLAHLNIRKKCL